MPVKLLAVAHEATLTGSPMNLLHFLRWLRANTDVEVRTLLLQDGPLGSEFREVGPVTVLDEWAPAAMLGAVQRGLEHLGSSRAWRPLAAARLRPQLAGLNHQDIVYLNSLPSIGVLPYLPQPGAVVAHVHELQVAWRTWRSEREKDLFRDAPDRWIAASGAVRTMLVDEVGLPPDRVIVCHEYIDAKSLASRAIDLREMEACRREYRIPPDAAVVMGAGTVDWRKGADLFIQLAAEVRRRTRDPVEFVWLGGDLRSPDWERVRSDLERVGVDQVHFVGTRSDPAPWFALADVFALTSREDPFPLVALECSALGKPVVTYRNGGIPELLEAAGDEAARGVVDHLDVSAMAGRVLELLESDRYRDAAGRQLQARVLQEHDVNVAAPALWAELRRLSPSRPAASGRG